ncbi:MULTISPECIES: hypothetical protein [Serratia]|uniref:hypothetical protein n=1 Tax=Serratia TaxID=613 RepID=UPI000AED70CB|nr:MULTISPECIES: hypothetical protein [Serratia]MDI3201077.1 hypothetical protein [Serratia ureilytica]
MDSLLFLGEAFNGIYTIGYYRWKNGKGSPIRLYEAAHLAPKEQIGKLASLISVGGKD